MKKYTVNYLHLEPTPPPGRQAGDEEVYFASDVDALIERAIEALSWCYDVTEWPAEDGSVQLTVLNELRAALGKQSG